MAINKVIYGGNILLDLTGDTVTPDQLKSGVTAHDKSGEVITGTCTHDVDSTDATVTEAEILSGKTAYARGAKVTGKMTNNGSVRKIITTKNQEVVIPQGFHDGAGSVTIASEEKLKIIPSNIRDGVTILGVEGTMSGMENVKAQAKTVAPSTVQQQVIPDEGYNYLSEVTVSEIPYVESDNAAGGTTVTIA